MTTFDNQDSASPTILVLHTGGTIGMSQSSDGHRTMTGFGQLLLQSLHNSNTAGMPAFDIIELDALIDSANLQPANWVDIANTLLARWDDYAGFVILHGTDTMAWTASALSFMLKGTDKPVILTGSQIPLIEPRSDALDNVRTAIMLAGEPSLHEVCIYFDRLLMRGNRSRKLRSNTFNAFDSPNCPYLADVGIRVKLYTERWLPASAQDFNVPSFEPEAVAVLPIYPGISAELAAAVLHSPARRGLILESYGVGNIADANAELMAVLADAVKRGIVVVNTSQCPTGAVEQGTYATGAALDRIGVVPVADMTPEATFAKLHFLLGTHDSADEIRALLRQSLCGEMS
ncbi:type I asparaginase [Granulosicoccus antarcticus]|uniref:asparaginase n=1 Tax=Granulosicoccus antarcticus IMCC3135 TaxID=1192854 RepID=A0A2Z2NS38_9GAMM|nr:type I asparaginase [Granulosicoccus antarcticus]ASJ70377.1 L-asparaginase 1 [Granulosicoccus antarcticus IMCC3135]